MTKSKKILAGVLTAVIAVGAVSGIVLGVRAANRQPVMVVSAGELNYGGGWYSSEMQGMITSDVSQDVYLTDTQTVSEVMVKEGDTVQEGDVLLTYDTAMTSLNLEREKLNRQQIDLKVQVAQENLKKLRNTIRAYFSRRIRERAVFRVCRRSLSPRKNRRLRPRLRKRRSANTGCAFTPTDTARYRKMCCWKRARAFRII